MTSHDIQTDDERAAAEAASDGRASFLRKYVSAGSAAYAVGGLALLGALRALRRSPRRAASYGVLGAAGIAIGTVQRRRSGEDRSATGLDEGRAITFEDQEDDRESGTDEGEATGTTTEELSSSTPDEARENDDISEAAVANEQAEAVGPSSTDSVPEQTDSTEPEATPEDDPDVDADAPSVESKDERTTPGAKADTPEEEIAEETDDGGDEESAAGDETGDDRAAEDEPED